MTKKILECHSKGDKRFSAFYAKITLFGETKSIEKFYQLSKRFSLYTPDTIKQAKGKKPDYFCLKGIEFEKSYQNIFYQTLWVFYFKQNSDLYKYACSFDDYHDLFKGKSKCNQEDTIRHITKIGLNNAASECSEFIFKLYDEWKKLNRK